MKAYILAHGEYSDEQLLAVFSSLDKCKAFCRKYFEKVKRETNLDGKQYISPEYFDGHVYEGDVDKEPEDSWMGLDIVFHMSDEPEFEKLHEEVLENNDAAELWRMFTDDKSTQYYSRPPHPSGYGFLDHDESRFKTIVDRLRSRESMFVHPRANFRTFKLVRKYPWIMEELEKLEQKVSSTTHPVNLDTIQLVR